MKFKTKQYHTFLALFIFYFLIWIVLRYQAVVNNVMFGDDFYFDVPAPAIWLTQYRPFLSIEYMFWNYVFPDNFFLTMWPKIIAGSYLSLSCCSFYFLIKKWKIANHIAALIPVIFISHPIINEITSWNITHALPLIIFLIITGILMIHDSASTIGTILGVCLLVLGIMGYQFYFIIFLLIAISETVLGKTMSERTANIYVKKKIILFIGVALFYVIYVFISKNVFHLQTARGFVEITSVGSYLNEKYHGLFNIFVNVYMPLVSFYFDIETAWKRWELIPLSLALITFLLTYIRRRSSKDALLFGILPVLLPFIATTPVLAISQSPESWRVAVPALFAACISLIPLLSMLDNGEFIKNGFRKINAAKIIQILIIIGIFTAEAIVTRYEAQMRVDANKYDREIVKEIERYWLDSGFDKKGYSVGLLNVGESNNGDYYITMKHITQAYHRIGLDSAFSHDFSWKGFLEYHEFQVKDFNANDKLTDLQLLYKCCNEPDFIQRETGRRICHSFADKLIVICQ